MYARMVCVGALLLFGCGGSDGGGDGGGDAGTGDDGSAQSDVSFEGEVEAFPGYANDTGWLPDGSPIQVKLLFSMEGKVTATAQAVVGGSADAPEMKGKADAGTYDLSVKLVFQALVKVDFAAVTYEGPVGEDADISFEIAGNTTFTPFLVDDEAPLQAPIEQQELARIPLASSIPAVTGDLVIDIAGTIDSTFSGTCAAVSAAEAEYHANTSTGANLILRPSVEIEIPLVLDETLEAFDIPVQIPAIDAAMDLGTKAVTPQGGPVDAEGSAAIVGACAAAPDTGGPEASGWNVVITYAERLKAEPAQGWDEDGSLPDLFVTAKVITAAGTEIVGQTPVSKDTLKMTTETTVLSGLDAADIMANGLTFELFDDDPDDPQALGGCNTSIDESKFDGEPHKACWLLEVVEVRFRLEPTPD